MNKNIFIEGTLKVEKEKKINNKRRKGLANYHDIEKEN